MGPHREKKESWTRLAFSVLSFGLNSPYETEREIIELNKKKELLPLDFAGF